jgi:hypothetical protein
LRRKDHVAIVQLEPADVVRPDLADLVTERFANTQPYMAPLPAPEFLEVVSFVDDPAASFGDVEGSGIPGNAGYDLRSIFQDGFESGDLSNWSSTMPSFDLSLVALRLPQVSYRNALPTQKEVRTPPMFQRMTLITLLGLLMTTTAFAEMPAALAEQVAKLTADDAAAYDEFGYSVALSGTTALVGAYRDNSVGSAYIFSTGIFADGFESGDVSAWSNSVP